MKNKKMLNQNHYRTRVYIAIYGDISEYLEKNGDNFDTLEELTYWDNTDIFKLCATY